MGNGRKDVASYAYKLTMEMQFVLLCTLTFHFHSWWKEEKDYLTVCGSVRNAAKLKNDSAWNEWIGQNSTENYVRNATTRGHGKKYISGKNLNIHEKYAVRALQFSLINKKKALPMAI